MTANNDDHAVDVAVGRNIILRRKLLGMSQTTLGAGLRVSFQQVQKYERGSNRVSASVLWRAAGVLRCEVADFFDGVSRGQPNPIPVTAGDGQYPERVVRLCLAQSGGVELARALAKHSRPA